MLSFLRSLIKNLFVCVFIDEDECKIYGQIVKNNQKVGTIEANFEIIDGHIDHKFNDYIKKNLKKASSTYVALLLNSKKQWALPVNDHDGYNRFGVNFNEVHTLDMPGDWSIFIPKDEIEREVNFINGMKIDLLYSPFALLYEKICEFKADERITLYVYAQESSCAIMIFSGLKMLYANFYNTEASSQKLNEEDEAIAPINIADIDNIIAKEDDKLHALSVLDDLNDNFDELSDENSEKTFEDITEEEDIERTGAQIEESLQKVGRSGLLLNDIKEAMLDFYKNPLYESAFVEKIVVFDSEDILDDQNFSDVVGHEIFIEATVFAVDRTEDLFAIIKRDLRQ